MSCDTINCRRCGYDGETVTLKFQVGAHTLAFSDCEICQTCLRLYEDEELEQWFKKETAK